MGKSLISIIVPAFNASGTIKATLDSLFAQSYDKYEVIVVDDGSTDNTWKLLQDAQKQKPQLVLHHQPNKGVSTARNTGLSIARGEYICFCDADDLYSPSYLQEMYAAISSSDADWVHCNRYITKGNRTLKKPQRIPPGEYNHMGLMSRVVDDGTLTGLLFSSVCLCIYKRSIIVGNSISFDADVAINEDGVFNLKYFFCSDKCMVIPSYLYTQIILPMKGKPRFEGSDIFDNANRAIHEVCEDRLSSEESVEQFKRRRVTLTMQQVLICNKLRQYKDAIAETKSLLNDPDTLSCYPSVKTENLDWRKRIVFMLMKVRACRTLWLLISLFY
jgi:glycosyltransferase involved in cell wall biosynthesis